MSRWWPSLVGVLLVACAGVREPTVPLCASESKSCAQDSDCCGGLQCTKGACAKVSSVSTCRTMGQVCGATSDCCNPLLCQTGECAPAPMCRMETQACAATVDCCNPLVCRTGACSPADTRVPFGSSCTVAGDCLTGFCLIYQGDASGVCSSTCASSASCSQQLAGYACIGDAKNGNTCNPTCSRTADCQAIEPTWTCDRDFTAEGTVTTFCAPWLRATLGYPCLDDSQCSNGTCLGNEWCSTTCARDAVCGQIATCIFDTSQLYECFPTCNRDADCLLYPNTTCQAGTSRDGFDVNVCAG